jgi:ribose 5-phosphate isomerase B
MSSQPALPRLVAGSDHAGIDLKNHLVGWLRARGYEVDDLGTHDHSSCHYPDYAAAVAGAVAEGRAELGMLVCGTGQGMAMAANRLPSVRAGVVADTFSAAAIREHNDARVICLGQRVIGPGLAEACLDAFLGAEFQGGRHAQRLAMFSEVRSG